jgi:histidyl-tRNA synthetase
MAPGLTTTELFLHSHKLTPTLPSTTEVYLVVLDSDVLIGATRLAANLRKEGVNTEIDTTGRKLDKQIKTAIKKNIASIIFVGEAELKSGIYTFKDTASNDEQKLSFERIVSTVKDRRRIHSDDLDDLFE